MCQDDLLERFSKLCFTLGYKMTGTLQDILCIFGLVPNSDVVHMTLHRKLWRILKHFWIDKRNNVEFDKRKKVCQLILYAVEKLKKYLTIIVKYVVYKNNIHLYCPKCLTRCVLLWTSISLVICLIRFLRYSATFQTNLV